MTVKISYHKRLPMGFLLALIGYITIIAFIQFQWCEMHAVHFGKKCIISLRGDGQGHYYILIPGVIKDSTDFCIPTIRIATLIMEAICVIMIIVSIILMIIAYLGAVDQSVLMRATIIYEFLNITFGLGIIIGISTLITTSVYLPVVDSRFYTLDELLSYAGLNNLTVSLTIWVYLILFGSIIVAASAWIVDYLSKKEIIAFYPSKVYSGLKYILSLAFFVMGITLTLNSIQFIQVLFQGEKISLILSLIWTFFASLFATVFLISALFMYFKMLRDEYLILERLEVYYGVFDAVNIFLSFSTIFTAFVFATRNEYLVGFAGFLVGFSFLLLGLGIIDIESVFKKEKIMRHIGQTLSLAGGLMIVGTVFGMVLLTIIGRMLYGFTMLISSILALKGIFT